MARRRSGAAPHRGGPATPALYWAHARPKFFELADMADITDTARSRSSGVVSPIALEAVTRMNAIFGIERTINGAAPEARLPTGSRSRSSGRRSRSINARRARPVLTARSNRESMDYMLKGREELSSQAEPLNPRPSTEG